MSSAPTPEEIARNATWLVQALDTQNGIARLVRMDGDRYRAASFLDDRMFQPPVEAHVVPWQTVRSAVELDARRDARWIFHIGHVGSTLVARLLGELEGVLSIREPRFLRDVSALRNEDRREYTNVAQALFSRTFAADGAALVKATSFVSEIAPELVPPGQRALFMYAAPRNYIGSILAGENSLKELSALVPVRAQRISGRAKLPLPRTAAEAAAVAWACEMTSLEAAAEQMAGREIAWADFDTMLADMPGELGRVARFFGFAAPVEAIQEITQGPLMRRYSKALEFDYSAALRRDLIAEAEQAHLTEIDSALAMLEHAAEKSPLLARALARSKEN